MLSILTFTVKDTLFGFNALQIKEINDTHDYSVVPGSDQQIRGILNIRGKIITIFDLSQILGWDTTATTSTIKNIIFKTEHETENLDPEYQIHYTSNDIFGFMVEKINDIVEIAEESLQPPPANIDKIAKEYIKGVVRLKEGLVTLLKVENLIEN